MYSCDYIQVVAVVVVQLAYWGMVLLTRRYFHMHARTCDFSCCLESGVGSILEFQRLIPLLARDLALDLGPGPWIHFCELVV